MTLTESLNIVFVVLQVVIGYNLVLPLLLYAAYMLVPRRSYTAQVSANEEIDYGIIVTAYQQTDLLPAVVDSLLKLRYSRYLIYIVADDCDITNLHFDDERVVLLRPEHVLAGNTRSHLYAIKHFRRPHTVLTIIDSDNLVKPDYLDELSIFFGKGFEAVQGARLPKDLETTYSALDAARDIYYHFYDGKVLFSLGSSATLAGSGMAFTTALYLECLGEKDVSGAGFDKVLQAGILSKGLRIAFNGNAVVYDEKTSQTDQLVKQRARWINTWFRFFGYGFNLIAKGVLNFNWNQFLFGIILLRPPLFIFILLSGAFMAADLWINPVWSLYWIIAFACFFISFFLSLAHSATDKRIYRSLFNIPVFMFYQVLSLLKIRKANKISVATTHKVKTPPGSVPGDGHSSEASSL